MINHRNRFAAAWKMLAVALLALTAGVVSAQTPARTGYPAKAITLVIPSAAGGGLDVAMRHVARRLSEEMGVPVVAENRPGVNLLIGTRYVASAPADGYTLLAMSNTFLGATVFGDIAAGYDPFRDFITVSSIAMGANVLLVNSSSGITSARDLVDRAKKAGANKLSYGTAGVGSSPHVAAALFVKRTATDYIDVPYKGTAPAMVDLLGGRLTFLFDSVVVSLPHVKSGALKPLAVSTAKRSALMPDVPTMAEAMNLPDYNLPLFYGIAVPAKTPPDVVKTLHAALSKLTADPALRDQFATMGFELQGSESPEEYTRFLRQQLDNLKSLKN
jgi:tripartite-type tricarboxylate transporter receptor subunit TctC